MRFRDRHQAPEMTDIEYAAQDQRSRRRRRLRQGAFRRALVRLDGRLRRRPAVPLPDGRAQAADPVAEISAPAHRHAEADGRPWRLLRLHLFGARRRRLSDVRHHADADLRSQSRDQLSARLHVPVQSRRHRQMAADRASRIRFDRGRRRGGQVRAKNGQRRLSRSTTSSSTSTEPTRSLRGRSMAIKVIKPGLATTVQDLGRPGYYHIGIPLSGGMDRFALRAANMLVGNPEGAAVLEAAFLGPELNSPPTRGRGDRRGTAAQGRWRGARDLDVVRGEEGPDPVLRLPQGRRARLYRGLRRDRRARGAGLALDLCPWRARRP